MTSKSKIKGNRVEREIVETCKFYGLEAKRAWGSNGKALGESEKVDIVLEGPGFKYTLQVKAKKEFPKWLMEAEQDVDLVVFKQDRKLPKVLIDLGKFLSLLNSGEIK